MDYLIKSVAFLKCREKCISLYHSFNACQVKP